MLRPLSRLALCSSVIWTAACSDQDLNAPDAADQAELSALSYFQNGPTTSNAQLVTFADPNRVVGRSVLHRADAGVRVRVESLDLDPGTAVTLWLVVFNEPGACDGPCDEPDLFADAVKTDVLYAYGEVIDASGRGTFHGERLTGDASASVWELFGLPSYGILDPNKAEIHVILRTHGPVIDDMVDDMIGTFNGGCAGMGDEFGTPGPNTCEDIQFAVHAPQ